MPRRDAKKRSEAAAPLYSAAFLALAIHWPVLWDVGLTWIESIHHEVSCGAERILRDFIWHAYRGGF